MTGVKPLGSIEVLLAQLLLLLHLALQNYLIKIAVIDITSVLSKMIKRFFILNDVLWGKQHTFPVLTLIH
jgi:hypothetical protein